MSSRPSVSRQDSLLAAIQRKTSTPAPAAPSASLEAPPAEKAATAASASRKVGKPVQFWLHEGDRKIIRELAAWLAGQGIRPTDSMVVRAALRMAKTGPGLLECYRDAALLDGRLKSR
jgi:hypothetical protein